MEFDFSLRKKVKNEDQNFIVTNDVIKHVILCDDHTIG